MLSLKVGFFLLKFLTLKIMKWLGDVSHHDENQIKGPITRAKTKALGIEQRITITISAKAKDR